MHGSITFANNADTFTTESITAETTVIPVIEKSTSVFPKIDTFKDQYFYLMIIHANDQSKYEYLKCTNITDDSFTVERGKEGTTPQNFPRDSRIINTLSTQGIYDVQEQSRLVRPHAETTTVYGSGTAQDYGHVKLTDNFELGTQAIDGVACTPKALREAIRRLTALPKEQLFTTAATWKCPETGTYTITCVGGGGSGGTGGYLSTDACGEVGDYTRAVRTGGGGGGGGAGQSVTKSIQCTKDAVYGIAVGGPAGASAFGSDLVIGLAGGTGGTGGNGYIRYSASCSSGTNYVGGGGALGTSYGTGGTGGGSGNSDYYEGYYAYCPYRTVYGGGGGTGANSIFGTYGRGGNGGEGQRMTNPGNGNCNPQGPWGGSAGTQGCIKIVYPLGK